jgi:hypothetical protein
MRQNEEEEVMAEKVDDLEARAQKIMDQWSCCDKETSEELIRLIAQALRDEREACAKVVPTSWCDPAMGRLGDPPYWCTAVENLLKEIAAAIREGRT